MMISESYKKRLQELAGLNEVWADGFKVGRKEFDMYDNDAIPFLYYMDKLYIKSVYGYNNFYTAESHWSIIADILNKKIDDGDILIDDEDNDSYSVNQTDMMEDTNYNGRLWVKSKVIAFWKLPDDNDKLIGIVKDLNGDSMGEFHIDGNWRLAMDRYDNDKNDFITLNDYTGGELSDEEKEDLSAKWKEHIMSPLVKHKLGLNKVPDGFGSKHPDYAGHRVIDRAVGRAEQ